MRIWKHRVPDPRGFRNPDQAFNEIIVDRALQQEARTRDTGLPRRCVEKS
jgi:hypothetical protein